MNEIEKAGKLLAVLLKGEIVREYEGWKVRVISDDYEISIQQYRILDTRETRWRTSIEISRKDLVYAEPEPFRRSPNMPLQIITVEIDKFKMLVDTYYSFRWRRNGVKEGRMIHILVVYGKLSAREILRIMSCFL